MRTIKWGIIGTGNIATKFATALNRMENIELEGVASRDLRRAEDFAKRFHFHKAYGSYEELAKDPSIDVIYISTPHQEHKGNAALCIRNKKSVLCEKPFTLNKEEALYLISLAREHKVFLMEAMWTKYLPVTGMVKQWINEKKIGNVKYIQASFGSLVNFNEDHRVFNLQKAGGALLDVGIYPLTYAIYMLGSLPEQVVSTAVIGRTNVDEQNVISLRFKEGALADLSSAITAETGNDAWIIGDKGKIFVPYFWKGEKAQRFSLDGELLETYSVPFLANGYEYEAEEVNKCIWEGKLESDIHSLSDTLNIITIMDQIREQWGLKYPQELI